MYKRIRISRTQTRDKHRLVMEEFIRRQLLSSEVVHHKDENPKNNDIANLEIMSRSEHARMHRLGKTTPQDVKIKISNALTGTKSPFRKLTDQQIEEIKNSDLTQRQLAAKYGVTKTTIQTILAGQIYRI